MDEKIDNATSGKRQPACDGVSEDILRALIGNGNIGFDAYQMVYPQERLWVLDMRFVSNDEASLINLRGHLQVTTKAYARWGRGGRYLRLCAWGGIEEFIH